VPIAADDAEPEIVSRKSVPHHISRAKRRVDAEREKKVKKRQWMMAMYREGLAKEKSPGDGEVLAGE
jgi:hypothetical protein